MARYYSYGRSRTKQEIYIADVALDRTDIDNLAKSMVPDANGRAWWGQLFTHQLGHTVGLDHVGPDNQMMNAFVSDKNPRLGNGDLAGMSKKGARNGCWDQTKRSPGRGRVVAPSASAARRDPLDPADRGRSGRRPGYALGHLTSASAWGSAEANRVSGMTRWAMIGR